jgi:acyl-CoA synthetase (AMP-forming)/AMP-acid ligase II
MNKVAVLGEHINMGMYCTRPTADLYRQTGLNTGNLAFIYAVLSHLQNEVTLLPWHASPEQYEAVDIIVIPCANQLGKHTDLGRHAELLRKSGKPVVAIGLGAQAEVLGSDIELTEGTATWVETIRAWRAVAPGHFLELYGMLEDGYQTYTRPDDDPEAVAGSVGRVASHMGLRLLDPEGRDVPAGQEGEICAEGPSVLLGYHANPQANADAFTADGWFRSGDLGFIDGRGNLRISGRVKEMINRGGMKYFPREVEEVLYAHPAILYCAIVGLPDPRLGERACLCVVPREGHAAPTLQDILAFLGDGFATYKLPERLVVLPELPFTPTGKIQRHRLVKAILDAETTERPA